MEFTIDRSKWRCGGEGKNKIGIGRAMLLNDDEDIDQKEREYQLKALFKEHGHTIKFINKTL